MKTLPNLIAVASCLALNPTVNANPVDMIPELTNIFDYDYVQGTITSYDVGGSGFTIQASKDLQTNINLTAAFSSASDYVAMSIGGGYHYELGQFTKTDAMFFGGLERAEFNAGGGTADTSESGVFVGAGVRASASPTLELTGEATYHTLGSGDLSVLGGARLQINQQFDLTVDYTVSDNDVFTVGARMYY